MRELLEILEDDFAEDIIVEWDSYIEDGCEVGEVTSQILDQYGGMLDEVESVILYVTLALLQAEQDRVEHRIKEEVLEILGTKKLEQIVEENKNLKKLTQVLKNKCR
ncbi:MAG: hypothetical protein ACRC1P_05875 [Cellulosilyticaceae bacterium]